MTTTNPSAPTDDLRERYDELRNLCETIWPAIRFWGLSGADPHYVVAAMEIGRLLGKIEPAASIDTAHIAAGVRRETILEVSQYVASSGEIRSQAGIGLSRKLSDLIASLADSPPAA